MSSEPDNGASTGFVYIPDHAARNAARMLSQDRDKPRMIALAEALGQGAQTLEDVIFDLLVGRRLEAATGAALNAWGEVVGEKRGPLGDEDYRRFIRARILANTCKGTPDELIAVFRLVCEPVIAVRWFLQAPASYTLQVVRPSFLSTTMRRRIRRIMEDVRPAGVGSELIEAIPGPFGYADTPDVLGYDVGVYARVL
jgi:hypothetical protein